MKFEKKQFTKYMLFAFVFAWVLQIIASVLAIQGKPVAFRLILMVVMFMPLLATICAGIPLKGMGWIPKLKGKVKYVLLAILIPAVLTVAGTLLFFAVYPNSFDLTGEMLTAQVGETAIMALKEKGMTVPIYLAVCALQCLFFAPFINMFTAIGEEAGWRGVLYPMLKDRFGSTKGRIYGGLIWGAWHWPVMCLAGYEYNVTIWSDPIKCLFGMFLFCVVAACMGIVIDDLYKKTNIIWIPAIAHGAINAMATVPVFMVHASYSDKMMFGPTILGVISGIPMFAYAIMVCMKDKTK